MVRFRTRGRGRGRRVYPIRGGYGYRRGFPRSNPSVARFTRSSLSGRLPKAPKLHPPTSPEGSARRNLSFEPYHRQVEDEILSYVASQFGQDFADRAKPIVASAIRLRPGARPGVGIDPVINVELKGSEVRGTVGLDFPMDLTPLPMGPLAAQLVRDPKFYVRVEGRVRMTPKHYRLKLLQVRVGLSAQPIGMDAKDVHWGRDLVPAAG